ncbi:hypothetical protein FNF28_03374 [Cafeteria roenbergensis]|uniref:Calmodulin n=1 Tax=Cafeteria roenbergensis TaxID=33653 RepID=A0A5A8DL57_CAFRO|nr:hypothetical protein FNF28_03374 [Cafeteria roenbergensis]
MFLIVCATLAVLGISRGASDAVVAVVRGASGGDCATSGDNIAGASFGERFCQDPVDVVYTWVNGSDPVWLRQMRHFRSLESAAAAGATDAGAGTDAGGATAGNATSGEDGEPRPPAERDGGDTAGANRYRDNEELRYSLRSLFKYAPWVRNVILVTNGQVPLWLNTDHPRIRVVTHEEIFPDSSQLPVFSSPAIEVHLHRIPGLSRRFIYFNDDVLLGADVWPDDFWSHAAGHMVYFSWEVPKCNAGCIDSWIGDGFCDRACNTSRCMWDDGDCSGPNIKPGAGMSAAGLGAAGGTSFATHSGYGGSTVHYCAEGCPANWPGDKTCDSRCNVASCGFDAADCTLDDVYRGVPGAEPVAARGGARLGSTAEAAASSAAPAAAARAPAAAAAEGPVAEGAAALGGQAGAVAAAEAATLAALDAAAAAAEEALDAERRSCRRAANSSDAEEQCEALATGRVPSPAGPMSDARFGVDVSPAELVLRGKDAAWYVNVSSLALGAARAVMARMGCVGETVGSTRGAMQGSPDSMPATLSNATRCRPQSVQEADIEWTLAEYPPEAGGWLPTVVLAPHAGMLVALADPVADQSADEALALSGAAVESGAGAAAAGGTTSLSKLPTARMAWAAGNAGRRLDTYGDSLVKTNTIISSAVGRRNRKVPAHMPHMIDREEMEKLQNWEPMREAWQQTSSRRFRSPEDVQYAFAFFYWVMEAAAASGGTQRAALERFWARELDSNGDGVIDTNEFRTLAAIVKGGAVSDFDVMEVLSCVAPSGNATRHTVQLPNGAVVETVSVETPAVTLDGVLKCSRTAEALKRKVKERAPPTHTIASEAEVAFEMIGDDFNRTQEQLDSVRARRAKFICINDDMDVAPPALQQVLRDFFDSYFPEQCAMELEYGWENRYQYIGPMRRLKVVQLVLRVVGWGALLVAVAGVVASYLASRVGAAKRGDDDEDGRDEGAAPAAGPPALRQRVRHEE